MTQLPERALTRRLLLKRGAAVGVGTAWVVPVVQGFSMTAAHAASPSGLPIIPQPVNPPVDQAVIIPVTQGSGIDPIGISAPGVNAGPATNGSGIDAQSISKVKKSASKPSSSTEGLAATGPAVPAFDVLKYGAAALAVGTAAVAAGRRPVPATQAAIAGPRRPRPGPRTPRELTNPVIAAGPPSSMAS